MQGDEELREETAAPEQEVPAHQLLVAMALTPNAARRVSCALLFAHTMINSLAGNAPATIKMIEFCNLLREHDAMLLSVALNGLTGKSGSGEVETTLPLLEGIGIELATKANRAEGVEGY